MTATAASQELVSDLISFLNCGKSPFHVVAETRRRLLEKGFQELSESDCLQQVEGSAFVIRGGAAIIAWRRGRKTPCEAGFRIVGAHTDQPCLRPKPGLVKNAQGLNLLDVEPYGGMILATWPDRPLSLAGRLIVEVEGQVQTRLVSLDGPLCCLPNVAIHLNRSVNDEGLKLNKHKQMSPVLSMGSSADEAREALLESLAQRAQIPRSQILDHDLFLLEAEGATLWGMNQEFISSGKLDDLAMCHAGLRAMLESERGDQTAVLALFDHEECGSNSYRGAGSDFLPSLLARLAGSEPEALARALSHSMQISADMAHAVHPLYADLHDGTHVPSVNGGPVIKVNHNQRYATDGLTAAVFRNLCKSLQVPCQQFVSRPDMPCGSTIGSLTAAYGIATVDVGNPMWAMHSVRESAGAQDAISMTSVMKAFLSGF